MNSRVINHWGVEAGRLHRATTIIHDYYEAL